jgi:hypothetical protein
MRLSSRNEYVRMRNLFSIILAQLRTSMSPGQFRLILRLQACVDDRFSRGWIPSDKLMVWLTEISEPLQNLHTELEKGKWLKTDVSRIVHTYRHLLD